MDEGPSLPQTDSVSEEPIRVPARQVARQVALAQRLNRACKESLKPRDRNPSHRGGPFRETFAIPAQTAFPKALRRYLISAPLMFGQEGAEFRPENDIRRYTESCPGPEIARRASLDLKRIGASRLERYLCGAHEF